MDVLPLLAVAGMLFAPDPGAQPAAPKPLDAGDAAPAFELQGTDGKTWRLADFAGRQAVVVAWFPKAFTGG